MQCYKSKQCTNNNKKNLQKLKVEERKIRRHVIVLEPYSFIAGSKFTMLKIQTYNFKNLYSNNNVFHVFLTFERHFMK